MIVSLTGVEIFFACRAVNCPIQRIDLGSAAFLQITEHRREMSGSRRHHFFIKNLQIIFWSRPKLAYAMGLSRRKSLVNNR